MSSHIHRRSEEYTAISNSFIDKYMAKAPSPQFSLVYIYLCRLEGCDIDYADIAKKLNIIESDVINAIKYWKSVGLLLIDDDNIYFAESIEKEKKKSKKSNEAVVPVAPSYMPREIEKLDISENGKYKNAFTMAASIFGKTLSNTDAEILVQLYDQLNFSDEMVALLLTQAKNKSRRMKYVETMALDWHDRGIDTISGAQEYLNAVGQFSDIMAAFGISGRQPSLKERPYILKWKLEYKLPQELIIEACGRTIEKKGRVNFAYTDGILTNWKEKGYTTIEQVKAEEEKYRAENANQPKPKNTGNVSYNNKFNDFSQRKYTEEEFKKIIERKGGI